MHVCVCVCVDDFKHTAAIVIRMITQLRPCMYTCMYRCVNLCMCVAGWMSKSGCRASRLLPDRVAGGSLTG
jgi:hypothetical protein